MALAGGIALPAAVLVYLVAGSTLGLFFGGVVVVTLVLPPMVLQRHRWVDQALIASAVNDSVGVVWLLCVLTPQITLTQWLMCYVMLAAYSFALWGLVNLLRGLRMPAVPAAAATILVAMLWLSWPIWMSRLGADRAVGWLAPANPLFTLNGVLSHLGIWSERPIAYNHLMNLGQDVAYRLPDGILVGAFAHIIAAGVFFAVAGAVKYERTGDQV